jgi:hypothetical protein
MYALVIKDVRKTEMIALTIQCAKKTTQDQLAQYVIKNRNSILEVKIDVFIVNQLQ